LHLDEAAVAGLHDIHVNFGAAVVVVRQIEQRLASTMPTLMAAT
jgi:hypothetical protein